MDNVDFKVGDLVRVTTRDLKDQKVQKAPFEGVVISIRGEGVNKTFTVRKQASAKVAIERIWSLGSATIEKIKVVKRGKVRRAKLYYLRNKS